MPQDTKSIHHQTEHEAHQGLTASAADPDALRQALQLALDYRGDVTIQKTNGDKVDCFIFDIKQAPNHIMVRAIPKDRDEKLEVPFAEIDTLTFTGRDTAAGKSFDTWMKNYVKKKLAGEEASIHSESLE